MRRYASERLCALAETILRAAGSEAEEAGEVARILVGGNLAGHDSHGLIMLGAYVDNIRAGTLRPNTRVRVVRDSGPILVLDGGRGFGQIVAGEAMDLGMARARELGAAIVALRNSHHCGRIGEWGERCARHGFASVHFVSGVSHEPLVAAHGGAERRLLTNPFCAAMPDSPAGGGDGPAVLLDMATSVIAFGKVKVARNRGVPVPEGCLIDKDGRPTTDPVPIVDRREGAVLPFGGYKGAGLGLMMELLAGALTGAPTVQPGNPRDGGIINHMLSVILDPAAFADPRAIAAETEAVKAWMRSSRTAPGVEEILLPGDPERRARDERSRLGVPLDPRTIDQLLGAGTSLGLAREALQAALES
jgi:hydroxycarboxylate dehydrogenase B